MLAHSCKLSDVEVYLGLLKGANRLLMKDIQIFWIHFSLLFESLLFLCTFNNLYTSIKLLECVLTFFLVCRVYGCRFFSRKSFKRWENWIITFAIHMIYCIKLFFHHWTFIIPKTICKWTLELSLEQLPFINHGFNINGTCPFFLPSFKNHLFKLTRSQLIIISPFQFFIYFMKLYFSLFDRYFWTLDINTKSFSYLSCLLQYVNICFHNIYHIIVLHGVFNLFLV